MKIKAGIIGAAGYTGGELIRILLHHPQVKIIYAYSSSNGDKPIHEVHRDLLGVTSLNFSSDYHFDLDVLFLCSGHGKSREFMSENEVPEEIKVIDLSHDFRLHNTQIDRPFQYGLCEAFEAEIKSAANIANPGCFATCIQLALLPLAANECLNNDLHISAITGSTGAGQSLSATSHFTWRNNNVSVYKPFQHQHLDEINQSLKSIQPDFNNSIHFIPVRGNFTRGIYSWSYLNTELTKKEAIHFFQEYYKEASFVHISDKNPDLKMVVNTNNAVLHVEKHHDQLMIISMIDNLVKGASGQAVQNMNLIFDIPQETGLMLKPTAF